MKVVSFFPHAPALESRLAALSARMGLSFVRCAKEDDLVALTRAEGARGVVLLSDESALAALERLAASGGAPPPVVLFVSTPLPGLVRRLKKTAGIDNFVAINDAAPDESEVESVLASIARAVGGTLEDSIPAPILSGERLVRDARTKQDVIEDLHAVIAALEGGGIDGGSGSGVGQVPGGGSSGSLYGEYARKMAELVDELVLNAVFNANPRLRAAGRSEDFALSEAETVRVRWRWDGRSFGVSVRDPFGNLLRDTVMRYLDEETTTEAYSEVPSAGLGLKLVFDRLHRFIVNVEPERSTEVVCVARFERKLKDFERRIRSFHYFRLGDPAGKGEVRQ